MKPNTRSLGRQRGAAAVELAILVSVFAGIFAYVFFLGCYFWYYTAAQKAAHDAARYLSTVSEQEMRDRALAPEVGRVAKEIARLGTAEIDPEGPRPTILVYCGTYDCVGVRDTPLPQTVKVVITMDIYAHAFKLMLPRYGIPIHVEAELPYVGD